ncbi:MAG: hypothetical protein J5722_05840 [Oscillospiraceae bacterium]|nr:hypothetical protein [Oscillospiraceae bacterium]
MRPDSQNQNDQAPMIYRELSWQLRLPESRIAEMEQQIRKKAAEKEQTAVVMYTGGIRRSPLHKLAYRIAPVAACALLALTGVFVYQTGLLKHSEYETAESEPEFAEQTGVYLQTVLTTDADETTETVTEAVTVYNPVPGISGENSLTAPPAETESVQTAAPPAETAEPAAAATVPVTETEPPVTETEPPATVTTEAVDPNAPPVVVVQETLPPPKIELKETPESAIAAVDDQKAHPGDTLTIRLVYRKEISQAGFQFFIRVKTTEDVPLPEVIDYDYPIAHDADLRISPTCRTDSEARMFTASFASADLFTVPAGTEVLWIKLYIPEDVPSGTVYELDDSIPPAQMQAIVGLNEKDVISGDAIYIGKIYIE